MEYEILGIDEGSSVEEAKKALNKIRLENHPDKVSSDEKERATTMLRQAESAYKRVIEKSKMNNMFQNFLGARFGARIMNDEILETGFHMGPSFGSFSINNLHDGGGESVQTSSYSYQNHNGKITESGTINGRPMTEDEMKKNRRGNKLSIHKHIR